MDERTQEYYASNAPRIGELYASIASPLRHYFAMTFAPAARVLDIGAGAGRDLAQLVHDGYEARGVEPVEAFRDFAIHRFPGLAQRLQHGYLPDELPSVEELGGSFGGVLCSAVLQHVPRGKLFDSIFALKKLLVDRGRVLVSVPLEPIGPGVDRDDAGRLFNGVTAEELELLFERAGFVPIGRWTENDGLERANLQWGVLAFELRFSTEARPIDYIEAVLSHRERKVATYKLALIRALCAIALTEFRRVTYSTDGMVRVPIDAIAERWIEYYWPLFDSPEFLPQMNGEMGKKKHGLTFTSELEALIESYEKLGGISAFVADYRSNRMPKEAGRLRDRTLKKCMTAIRTGPVAYARGAGPNPMFRFEDGCVLVPALLWRELSLMGHWIQDALILRWAELVQRLSSGSVRPERVIERLIASTAPDRECATARALYLQQAGLTCVWTGRRLDRSTLAVDHLIPYSLWRNNDLWNLLPAHNQVNGKKSDALPTRQLLRARRDPILRCWSASREAHPARFSLEAGAQTGTKTPDLSDLFDAMLESVEITAVQRAWPRWEPSRSQAS